MKKYLVLLIFMGLCTCIETQTLKETVRGKYGENLGTAETTIRGGKSVTVYKDKYGQRQAQVPVQPVMDCSLPEPLLPLIVISMDRRQVQVPPSILEILAPPCIEISMVRLLARVL